MKAYNKLIRDKIPEIMEQKGVKFKTKLLNDTEYKNELLKKLVEEAQEAFEARDDQQELVKEISDVLEVIDYTIKAFGLDRLEIEMIKKERKEARGGFDNKTFLEYTD